MSDEMDDDVLARGSSGAPVVFRERDKVALRCGGVDHLLTAEQARPFLDGLAQFFGVYLVERAQWAAERKATKDKIAEYRGEAKRLRKLAKAILKGMDTAGALFHIDTNEDGQFFVIICAPGLDEKTIAPHAAGLVRALLQDKIDVRGGGEPFDIGTTADDEG